VGSGGDHQCPARSGCEQERNDLKEPCRFVSTATYSSSNHAGAFEVTRAKVITIRYPQLPVVLTRHGRDLPYPRSNLEWSFTTRSSKRSCYASTLVRLCLFQPAMDGALGERRVDASRSPGVVPMAVPEGLANFRRRDVRRCDDTMFLPLSFRHETSCPFSMIVSIRFRSLRYDVPLRRFGALDSVLAALWMMDNSFYTYLGFALSLAHQ